MAQDAVVYEESDEAFYVGIWRSGSERLLLIHSGAPRAGGGREGGAALPRLGRPPGCALTTRPTTRPPLGPLPHKGSAVTNETRWLSADDPTGEFRVVLPRTQVCIRGEGACTRAPAACGLSPPQAH